MKKILFIINPKSGVDRVKALQNLIDQHLDHNKFEYKISHTEYAKHGTELARNAATKEGYQVIVAVGGDGSVNDIIAGLYNTPATLAIIPKGSGNGLARSLGIPLDTAKAIQLINNGSSVNIYLGKAKDAAWLFTAGS